MKGLIFLLFASLFLLLPGKNILAEEIIKSFDTTLRPNQSGEMEVTEDIVFDYGNPTENRHGIYRQIPKVTKVGDLYRVTGFKVVSVMRDGNSENYVDKSDQKDFYLVVGNPDRHIKGEHEFQLIYSTQNAIGSNYDSHDEIYWSVTGNNWSQPIEKASATIFFEIDKITDATCFTGRLNSTEKNCQIIKGPNYVLVETTKPLGPYEGLSVVFSFPKGTFQVSILQKENPLANNADPLIGRILMIVFIVIPLFLNLVLAPILLIWYFKNKYKNRFGKVSVNFDFPKIKNERITPAEAGTIDNGALDQNDVVATIFDFAIRKLIKIEQIKSGKILGILGGGDDYKIIKQKELEGGNEFEEKLWRRLFKNGNSINISDLKSDFYKTFDELKDKMFSILLKRGLYTKDPSIQRALFLGLAIFAFITMNWILGGVLILFYKRLLGRSKMGDEIDWQIDGLKLFLKNMSREHTWQAKNLITVEKYIPYAIALGFVKEFMEQLKIIYPDYKPDWYSGNLAFYTISSSMINSFSSGITTHAPSHSSGFSGGGFSGGGSGGGRGGSW